MYVPVPEAFVKNFIDQFGSDEADALLNAIQKTGPTSVRAHPIKGQNLFSEHKNVPWCQLGYYLKERPQFALDPLFHAGAYYVQEAGSMAIERLFEAITLPTDALVLDLSAAPGGKSTHLRSLLPNGAMLVCNEPIQNRANVLIENLVKWGHPAHMVTQNDPSDFGKSTLHFDLILVDAPCSGEGMFRKDHASRTQWSEQSVLHCAGRQKRILEDVWPCLNEGGYLIYSTCTFNRQENEGSIEELLNKGEAKIIEHNLAQIPGVLYTHPGFSRFMPHRTDAEGLSLILLQKTGTCQAKPSFKKNKRIELFRSIPSDPNLNFDEALCFFDPGNGSYAAFPEKWIHFAQSCRNELRIRHMGTTLYHSKGNKLQLHHDLAMSAFLSDQSDLYSTFAVNDQDALNFLRKNPLNIDTPRNQEHLLITYKNKALGWLRKAGPRWNNLYPMEWRLRMQ